MTRIRKAIVALVLFLPCPLVADVSLPALFSDNMVLQRQIAMPVWGRANADEVITVELDTQRVTTTADKGGTWLIHLSPMDAGGPYQLTVRGNNVIVLKNVMVGEVWVCSGQSNMAWPVRRSQNAEAEIAAANFPNIRLFTVERMAVQRPAQDVAGTWRVCDSESVANFSAVAYFFGRRLHKTQHVPIGLINTSWGGTPVEAWTALPALQAMPDAYLPLAQRWTEHIAAYPQARARFQNRLAMWRAKSDSLKAIGQTIKTRRPRAPRNPNSPHRPSMLYNGMIAPLIPYGIRGALWYQGESNAGRAYQYRALFLGMIQNWRANWGQGAFPFLFVQLANFRPHKENPEESTWAELREAQQMALSLPNTGMAVTIDIGEADDIHPRNKQDVGLRLALVAESQVYGADRAYSGPIYRTMVVEGAKIRLHFDHAHGGLKAKGKALKGFAIAGQDRKFVWATATLENNSVVVYSKDVPQPVAVRYAWADNPSCNLYNGADLPASPFRTDDWPGITADRR